MPDRAVRDVVVTKPVPPSVPAALIRLLSLLDRIAGKGCRLTVVVAPAGWGAIRRDTWIRARHAIVADKAHIVTERPTGFLT